MGVTMTKAAREAFSKSQNIDKDLKKEFSKELQIKKILLLGTGDSGKTTILKQMRILAKRDFSESEIDHQKAVVFANTMTGMSSVLKGMTKLGIKFDELHTQVQAAYFEKQQKDPNLEFFTEEILDCLRNLWGDKGVQEAVKRGGEFQMPDSAQYFLDALHRIGQSNYRPTQNDILRTRVRTTGIVEIQVTLSNVEFKVIDVGGQRSERKKWIHCFDNVNSIIFVSPLSEYDQILEEDEKTNRMQESLRLFHSIANLKWFLKTSVILFLNKKDLFAAKIKEKSLKICFPEYEGEQSYEECAKFVEDKFKTAGSCGKGKKIFVHHTCATDTENAQLVLNSTVDTIIRENLSNMAVS